MKTQVGHIEYGYARKTSKDKEAVAQLKALQDAGISPNNIFVDKPVEKEKFNDLLACLNPGDLLVIKSPAQLGYNYGEILSAWTAVTKERSAHIRVLDFNLLDTSAKVEHVDESLVSDLFIEIMSFAAQQERARIKHRQADGIALARAQGRHLGRPRIPKPQKFDEMYDMWRAGVISAEEVMTRLGLKRSTFERFVKERKEELKREVEQKAS